MLTSCIRRTCCTSTKKQKLQLSQSRPGQFTDLLCVINSYTQKSHIFFLGMNRLEDFDRYLILTLLLWLVTDIYRLYTYSPPLTTLSESNHTNEIASLLQLNMTIQIPHGPPPPLLLLKYKQEQDGNKHWLLILAQFHLSD